MAYDYTFGKGEMSIGLRNNAIEFYKHPGMFCGAITLGNTIHYPQNQKLGCNPYNKLSSGITVAEHESAHTIQGEILGPLYLPAHTITMGISIITTGDTHKNNWLEKGPNSNPPKPW